jgi:hypothetical protein
MRIFPFVLKIPSLVTKWTCLNLSKKIIFLRYNLDCLLLCRFLSGNVLSSGVWELNHQNTPSQCTSQDPKNGVVKQDMKVLSNNFCSITKHQRKSLWCYPLSCPQRLSVVYILPLLPGCPKQHNFTVRVVSEISK